MPDAVRDGVSLHYERAGSGQPPFVFVPGWCCPGSFFQPQFDYFQSSSAVVAMDLRGCGESSQPEGGYDIPTLADDVAGLCEALGISRPVVVGHSLGGMVAIELAARYPALPAAIVAVDPGPINPLPETPRLFETLIAQLEGPQAEAARRLFINDMFLPTDDAERKRHIAESMCATPARVAAALVRGVIAWNGMGAFALCYAPLLVLRSQPGGSNDPARLAPLNPNAQFGMTVGAGHFHQLEVPEQVNAMIERFVRIKVRQPAA
jgi:pimeloyl-ACP methyl ester carboxylesterase